MATSTSQAVVGIVTEIGWRVGFDLQTGCWVWLRDPSKRYSRYPKHFPRQIGNDEKLTHRYFFHMYHGPIGEGSLVCHHCDNTHCVNPEHLYEGSPRSNTQDKIDRDRIPIGEDHPDAKLSWEIVRTCRERYKPYDRSNGLRAMAREYGVDIATMSDAVHGRTWVEDRLTERYKLQRMM